MSGDHIFKIFLGMPADPLARVTKCALHATQAGPALQIYYQ